MERVYVFLAEFRSSTILGLTLRALHQHYTLTELQSVTARQECQALRM
jgi:hypothetical protein